VTGEETDEQTDGQGGSEFQWAYKDRALLCHANAQQKPFDLERCNPWPHVANRHMSKPAIVKLLLLVYGFKFRSGCLY